MATSATTFELPGFGGDAPHPGDAGYDDARAVFNAHDRPPPGADRVLRATPTTSSRR